MASGTEEMSFAEKQLAKFGWKKGMGLGKDNSGITEPIKVKSRLHKQGIGQDHKHKYQNWWDNAYNRVVDTIHVNTKEDGSVELSRSNESSISTHQPNLMKSNLLYNNFQQQGTLVGNTIGAAARTCKKNSDETSDSDSSDSADEEPTSKTGNGVLIDMTDEQLLKLCGGRTAHKGARHGIRMTGKMARIEEMHKNDYKLVAKWQKQDQEKSRSLQGMNNIPVEFYSTDNVVAEVNKEMKEKYTCQIGFSYGDENQNSSEDLGVGQKHKNNVTIDADVSTELPPKKTKKKSKSEGNVSVVEESGSELLSKKEKRIKCKTDVESKENGIMVENSCSDVIPKKKKKKRKNVSLEESNGIECTKNVIAVIEDVSSESVPKKKKKKSDAISKEITASEEKNASEHEERQEVDGKNSLKKKKKKRYCLDDDHNSEEVNQITEIKKKKKDKKHKEKNYETANSEITSDSIEKKNKGKKKNKKRKRESTNEA